MITIKRSKSLANQSVLPNEGKSLLRTKSTHTSILHPTQEDFVSPNAKPVTLFTSGYIVESSADTSTK
jgi:hypothetical protein